MGAPALTRTAVQTTLPDTTPPAPLASATSPFTTPPEPSCNELDIVFDEIARHGVGVPVPFREIVQATTQANAGMTMAHVEWAVRAWGTLGIIKRTGNGEGAEVELLVGWSRVGGAWFWPACLNPPDS